MIGEGTVWAFLGLPGIRELVVVAVVALVLYGRSGVLQTRQFRAIRPWLSLARRGAGQSPPPPAASAPRNTRWADRIFWFLTITAATAVAAWIVTRAMISAPSH